MGIIGFSHNITNIKKAEEALKEAKNNLELKVKERTFELSNERKRLYQIFEAIPVMICLISQDYRVPYANKAFRDKFGESEGKYCYEYCFKLSQPCDFCESFKIFETGEPHHWECRTHGSIIDVYNLPFTDIDGTMLILEIGVDITEFKRTQGLLANINELLEKKVAERTKALEISNRELEQFAYVASHDLQEPLRMISSFTQLLAKRYKDQLDSDADDYIDFIVEGSYRMKGLIDDLLTFSRLNTGSRKFQLTDLNQVLDNVLLGLKSTIEDKNAHIIHDNLPVVNCDPMQIGQLLQNLISNSIKFHETTPNIYISAEENGKEWIISVSDEGIGIDPKHQQKIFEVFKRLHSREEYVGTGIGLAICKKIVENHDGRIWVESEQGKGANFYFTIPKTK